MAYRNSIYSRGKTEATPQYLVTEARTHPNGFTVYKVVRRVPDPKSFDCFKESYIWKRYNDFKELYKCLATLHRKLYLNGKVPDFAKPKLFGRFEDSVVSERRESAENVLKFATEHPALHRCAAFREFFQEAQATDTTSEIKYLKQKPLKPDKDIEKHNTSLPGEGLPSEEHSSALTEDDLNLFDPFRSTKEFIESTSANQDENWIEETKKSFEGDPKPTCGPEPGEPETELDQREDSDLIEELRVTLSQIDLEKYHHREVPKEEPSTAGFAGGSDVPGSQPQRQGIGDKMDAGIEIPIVDGDAREKHRKSSKASAYLEAIIRRNRLQSEGEGFCVNTVDNPKDDKRSDLPSCDQGPILKPNLSKAKRSPVPSDKSLFGMSTRSSLLDLPRLLKDESSDDESKGAYLAQAAQQISFARTAENKQAYEEAFGHYKTAINTLLQGVQGDTNEARIQAVRRKTAAYLKRAEDIHSNHLKSKLDDNDLWKHETADDKSASSRPPIYPFEVQRNRRDTGSPVPSVPSPRHSSADLSCYKVLGTVGKILLILDTRNNETYALKMLLKSCKNRIRKGVIPTNVPFMVRLHRYYSTDHAVCLVVEHATGGRLWDQLSSYFEMSRANNYQSAYKNDRMPSDVASRSENGRSSTPKKPFSIIRDPSSLPSTKEEREEESMDEEGVNEKIGSTSFLDLCLDYETESKDKTLESRIPEHQDEGNIVAAEKHSQDPYPQSISDAVEDPSVNPSVQDEELSAAPRSHGTSDHMQIKRSWSYLSWDEAATTHPEQEIFTDEQEDVGDPVDFKKVSSHSDIHLFTIYPEEGSEQDTALDGGEVAKSLEDSIYDSRSNEPSDAEESGDEDEDAFACELLSEQDMSAVSLCGDKTLPSHVYATERKLTLGGSPIIARVADTSRASPCLSMNSSFEEDSTVDNKKTDGQSQDAQSPKLTRVVDENGVSSVDAVSLIRTHLRSKSTTSFSESVAVHNHESDVADGNEYIENIQQPVEPHEQVHSLFVGMDIAKERSMSYKLPESMIRRWGAEIVVAVGTLHSISILCRDLNPDNILLSADGRIRLTYFGKWKQVERMPCDKLATRRMYVAPEMSRVSEKKTEACDWWSVGSLLYELLTAQPLYIAHPCGINSHTILHLPDHLSPEAKSLLSGLLQYHPTQRLGYGVKGLDDLMDHPFFDGIEWEFLIEDYSGS